MSAVYSIRNSWICFSGDIFVLKKFFSNCKYFILFSILLNSFTAVSAEKENTGFFLAGIIDNKKILSQDEREKQLVALLDSLSSASSSLAVESSELAKEINAIISESAIPPARAAALRLKAQSVTMLAGKVAVLTEIPRQNHRKILTNCRIVAVNRELNIVAIEAGVRHGVFNGMIFHTLPGEPYAELRITATREDVSGAIVVKGSINQLGTGMRVSAVESRGSR